jgi:hypothetical protein
MTAATRLTEPTEPAIQPQTEEALKEPGVRIRLSEPIPKENQRVVS